MTQQPELSVVIPVGMRYDDLVALDDEYRSGLDATGLTYELIYVLDGPRRAARAELESIARSGKPMQLIQLGKAFGEATALMAGFETVSAQRILTLPAYFQIKGMEIEKLIGEQGDADMAVARRWPRRGSAFERLRRGAFHRILRVVTGETFDDLGCGARVFNRKVVDEISIYAEQHRLLPVLATKQGFVVTEVDVAQSSNDEFRGRYRAREYIHRLLDLFTVFFLVRFTRKPLRFFGMIGSVTFGVGAVAIAVLVIQRLAFDQPLADRPALLLSSLFIVLGAQLFALGLLGELIIFTHAKDLREYKIAEIVGGSEAARVRDSSGENPGSESRENNGLM